MPLLIRAGLLFDGFGGSPARGRGVLIRDGVIERILTDRTEPHELPDGVDLIDLGPRSALLPGFVDAHVHLVCTGGSAPFEEVTTQPKHVLERRVIINARTALAAGLTTLRDAGGTGTVTVHAREALSKSGAPASTLLVCGMPITTTGGHLHFFGLTADDQQEVTNAVERLIEMGVDFIKVMASPGIQTRGNDPFSSQYDARTLAILVGRARSAGLHVAAHAHSVDSIKACVTAGVNTIEHFTWLGGKDDDSLEQVAKQVVERDIAVDPTAIALDKGIRTSSGLSESQRNVMKSAIEKRNRCLAILDRAGVEIIAGTDAGSAGVEFADFAEGLRLLANTLGWDGSRAIRSATFASARSIGIGDVVGAIEPGKRADLVALDGDPNNDLRVLNRVTLVVKDGEIAVDRRIAQSGG